VPGVPGLPVHVTFRVRHARRPLYASLGLGVGLALSVPVWHVEGWIPCAALLLCGLAAGWFAAGALSRDRCVEPGCGAILPRGLTRCPKCGSTIIGTLAVGRAGSGDGPE
jgi:hypothetical protein